MSMSRQSVGSTTWVAWLPLLFIGAMLFWTLALALGGLSLMAVTALSADDDPSQIASFHVDLVPPPPTATEPMPGSVAAADGIVVRLQESPEPEDVNDDAITVAPSLDVASEAGP